MLTTIAAVFIILHGVTHAILAVVPRPEDPDAGFATFYSGPGSWLLSRLGFTESTARTTAILLSVIATLGFAAAGLALLGVLFPASWWRALASAAAVASLVIVISFWDRKLIVGLLIDVAVLIALLFID